MEQVKAKCVFCGNSAPGQMRKWASECGVYARAAIAKGLWQKETLVDHCLNCDNTQRVERDPLTGRVFLQGSTRPPRGERATRIFYAVRNDWLYKPLPLDPKPEQEFVITDVAKVNPEEQIVDNLPVRRASIPEGSEATITHEGG